MKVGIEGMATKYRIYNAKDNIILDNVEAPIAIEVEPGKAYKAGDFKYTVIDDEGNEGKLIEVPAFTAEDGGVTPSSVEVDPGTDTANVSGK